MLSGYVICTSSLVSGVHKLQVHNVAALCVSNRWLSSLYLKAGRHVCKVTRSTVGGMVVDLKPVVEIAQGGSASEPLDSTELSR